MTTGHGVNNLAMFILSYEVLGSIQVSPSFLSTR
jgi:hypothetical protein